MLDMNDEIKGPQCSRPRETKKKTKSTKFFLFAGYFNSNVRIPDVWKTGYSDSAFRSSYGHTTVKAPHPIRTAKLSTVGPDQYYGRGLRGNLRCCMSFFFSSRIFFSSKNVCACKKISVIGPIQLAKQRLAIIPSRPFG